MSLQELFNDTKPNPFRSTPLGVVLVLEKDINLEWKIINPAVLKYFPNKDFDFDQCKVDEELSDKSIKLVFIPFLKQD
jgi:hypothetical protein